jgi:ArsR family transcriptional regulator
MMETLNLISPEKLEKAAHILKTIAHPLRIAIVDLLSKQGKLSVGEITEILGSEQSLTSHHLSNMKLKGVLTSERDGQKILYSLQMEEVTGVLQCMSSCQAI